MFTSGEYDHGHRAGEHLARTGYGAPNPYPAGSIEATLWAIGYEDGRDRVTYERAFRVRTWGILAATFIGVVVVYALHFTGVF